MSSPTRPRTTYLVGRVDRLIRRRLETVLQEEGVTLQNYMALSVLATRPGLSNAQLARRSLMTPQGMNQAVNVLADQGLVRRLPHETNARILRIELSDDGRAALARCDRRVDIIEQEFLSVLSTEQRGALDHALLALADIVEPAVEPEQKPG